MPPFGDQAALTFAAAAVRQGRFADAAELLDATMADVYEGVDLTKRVSIPALAATMAATMGDLPRARRLLAQALDADSLRLRIDISDTLPIARCEVALRGDGPAAVGRIAAEHLALPEFAASLPLHAYLTEAQAALGEHEAAAATLTALTRLDAEEVAARAALVAHTEGTVRLAGGELDAAGAAFQRGIDAAASPYWTARCTVGLARIARHRIDGAGTALELLADASAAFEPELPADS